ncbi:MAG: S-methyl-5-thioribose-1-phosphate isomerase, partial [Verrucomicrobiota bacterium]|nr:S-methyl-5-thioribose-1-phosphate isomerase [Verrucomicrobiota bacterium]
MLETVRWITADGKVLAEFEEGVSLLPGKLRIIDQTKLPQELVYLELDDIDEMVDAIKRLSVRGAPAIGCAAALGLAAAAQHAEAETTTEFAAKVELLAEKLAASRPTAVNLFWALDRCRGSLSYLARYDSAGGGALVLLKEALTLLGEDIRMCQSIGKHGEPLIKDGAGILTHCNAGALATGDFGTALSP